MKKIILSLASLFIVAAVTGCNTVQGVGKDVEKVGEKVQDVAKPDKR